MSYIAITAPSSESREEDENRRIRRERPFVAGDPVERDGAVVLGPEALAAEPDVGAGAEEGREDGLDVPVPREQGEGLVGLLEGGEAREEGAAGAEDLEVGGGRGRRGGRGGGGG